MKLYHWLLNPMDIGFSNNSIASVAEPNRLIENRWMSGSATRIVPTLPNPIAIVKPWISGSATVRLFWLLNPPSPPPAAVKRNRFRRLFCWTRALVNCRIIRQHPLPFNSGLLPSPFVFIYIYIYIYSGWNRIFFFFTFLPFCHPSEEVKRNRPLELTHWMNPSTPSVDEKWNQQGGLLDPIPIANQWISGSATRLIPPQFSNKSDCGNHRLSGSATTQCLWLLKPMDIGFCNHSTRSVLLNPMAWLNTNGHGVQQPHHFAGCWTQWTIWSFIKDMKDERRRRRWGASSTSSSWRSLKRANIHSGAINK